MKKKTLLITIAASLVMIFALSACSGNNNGNATSDEETTSNEATSNEAFNPDEADGMNFTDMRSEFGTIPNLGGTLKIGAVAKAFENEYWRTLKEGMEIGADKLQDRGYDVSVDVKAAQGEGDEEGQLAVVKDMVNKKYDALLLSPISDGNLIPGVESAEKAGIPVINVNDGIIKNAPNYVGPRAVENGELAAEWVAEKINNEGKVAIVIGMPKAFAARQRTLGFETWMAENAPNIDIVEKQNADWDRAKAKDIAEIWIKKHDDLKAIFCNNDTMALGVQEAVNGSGKDILVIGVDGIGEAYDSIRKGEMDATIDSFPKYKGQVALEVALRIIAGQEIPRVIWTPQALIDSTNVDTNAEDIINWEEPEFE
jgi:ribose transport system substrate-binding protein